MADKVPVLDMQPKASGKTPKPPQGGSVATPPKQAKTIAQIVDDFIAFIDGHAEAKLLALDRIGKPNPVDEFKDVPLNQQRVITMRFLVKKY